ncbi:hypothetical protein ACFRC2_14455, partial [Bacillus subtilis]
MNPIRTIFLSLTGMARLAFIFGEILLRNEILSSLYAYLANIYIDTGFIGQAYSALCCLAILPE